MAILECVPNISEGRDRARINAIATEAARVPGVKLLDIDPGAGANRTVITFAGEPNPVCEAAFRVVAKAQELIDMRSQQGTHPRFGATDVCPLVPLEGITLEEVVPLAKALGERIGRELGIPVYLYGQAAQLPERRNLAYHRKGEYEGLRSKLDTPGGRPDYGPTQWNEQVSRSGAVAVGARKLLVAYNVNLNTTNVRVADRIAAEVRESGRLIAGPDGQLVRHPGRLKAVKAMGWLIEEYGIAQVSMNLEDLEATPLHHAFQTVRALAREQGLRVTGSELVGLIPERVLLDAADHFLRLQGAESAVPVEARLRLAVHSLGLSDLSPIDIRKKVIEYRMAAPWGHEAEA